MHKRASSRAATTKGPQETTTPTLPSTLNHDFTNELSKPGAKLYALISDVTSLLNEALEGNKGGGKEDDLLEKIGSCSEILRRSSSLVPLLGLVSSDVADVDIKRVAGKVDRAIERLRRTLSAWLDRFLVPGDSDILNIIQLFSVITDALETTIKEILILKISSQVLASLSDLITRLLDSIFTLAKYMLKLSDPQTHTLTCECLSRGTVILVAVNSSGLPLSNYLRCLSGAYYNFAGSLYQSGSPGSAIPFLKEACVIGGKALAHRSKEKSGGEEKGREQEGWKQLEETLFRRWELLGICHIKVGDRKSGYIAFLQSLISFPYSLHNLAMESGKNPPISIFTSTPAGAQFTQLATIIDRITYIGLNELLISAEQVSFHHSLSKCTSDILGDPGILGILVEQQIESLEQRGFKDSIQRAIRALLESALKVYDGEAKMPVRRARVILRLLEVLYRGNEVYPFERIRTLAEEVETLLCAETPSADSELSPYKSQYRALGQLWLALHAHKSALPDQVPFIADRVEKACRILRSIFGRVPSDSPKAVPKKSVTPQKPLPRTTRGRAVRGTTALSGPSGTKARVAANIVAGKKTATTNGGTKNKAAAPALKRAALQPISLNANTPPRTKAATVNRVLVFDDFSKLTGVLQTAARILDLLSLSLPKVQLLDVLRKLAEVHGGPTSEGYISASLDLAHEYMRIGKTRRAISIFNHALDSVRGGHVSDDTSAAFLLRFAESLALVEKVSQSISVYCEAMVVAQRIEYDEKSGSAAQRIQARTRRLEKAALAARTVAMIQHCQGDLTMSIELLLQSLRLWNRAMDNLARLDPAPPKPAKDDNPFDMAALKEALPSEAAPLPDPTPQVTAPPQRHLDSLGLRISEGLFTVLFDLAQIYLMRGSAKESEFFIKQALDLAQALNAPAIISRALAKQGEIEVRLGNLEEGHEMLVKAGEALGGVPTIDTVEVVRLTAECKDKMDAEGRGDAQALYAKSMDLLREIDAAFEKYEGVVFGPRRSLGLSPANGKGPKDVVVPDMLTNVLRQQIWLLRDQNNPQFNALLEQFVSLPRSPIAKAQENSLLAKLNLHNVYLRFQGDMFLNSLAESPIAIPMGMHTNQKINFSSAPDIINSLDQAEEQFWDSLSLLAQRGNVLDIRESAIALAVIKSFQTSMGKKDNKVHIMVSRLLDASAALTLRREMLEAIHHKFPRSPGIDDIQWPLITPEGYMLPPPFAGTNLAARKMVNIPVDSEDEEDEVSSPETTSPLKAYWDSVRMRYRSYSFNSSTLSSSQTENLPLNWTVIHISVTEDKNTLFISRQEGGPDGNNLVFSVPLRGRRDDDASEDEGEWLTFDGALHELREIVRLSDEGTKAAVNVKPGDEEARVAWWKQRGDLDSRLKSLLENIEFCWFGAFKTILNPKCISPPETIAELRTQFEKIFKRCFGIQDKKKQGTQRKTSSQHQPQSFDQVQLDDALLRCFSTLSPKCRDEELEDLIYFILDLYQFHSVPIPVSEVDITQMIVDLRIILEEHTSKIRGSKRSQKHQTTTNVSDDEHVFLVLDKNLQGLPWESIPTLRGRSVSRVPSMDFLIDRLEYAEVRRSQTTPRKQGPHGAVVDPRKGYFILNPSGDLRRTQERFNDWAIGMKKVGWNGVIGKPVSEQQFESALRQTDLVVYFGHGGGEQYLRSYKVRRMQTCAATMLWGCSSGALKEMGDFDRVGTANAYMLGGCPTLVANLWDVTDRDIDKFSQTVFDKLKLNPENISTWNGTNTTNVSLVSAVAQARNACKLKYLTGAAPVVYGIPFYV